MASIELTLQQVTGINSEGRRRKKKKQQLLKHWTQIKNRQKPEEREPLKAEHQTGNDLFS